MKSNRFNYQAQPIAYEIPTPEKKDQSFMHRTEAAVKIYIWQALAIFVGLFVLLVVIAYKNNWLDPIVDPFMISWAMGFVYFIFRLFRWDKLITRIEQATGVDLPGNDERPSTTMVIRLHEEDGHHAHAEDTGLDPKYKDQLMIIARCALQGAATSQAVMKDTFRISKPNWTKIMKAFVGLGVLEKESDAPNSKYVLRAPEDRSRAVLQMICNGEFEMIEEVWD